MCVSLSDNFLRHLNENLQLLKTVICPTGQKKSDEGSSSSSSKDREENESALDPTLQADMDEFLEECFKEGSLVRKINN